MDPGHKARKNPSDNADLGFQAVGPALRIMQLNVEGLSETHTRRRRSEIPSLVRSSHNAGRLRESNAAQRSTNAAKVGCLLCSIYYTRLLCDHTQSGQA